MYERKVSKVSVSNSLYSNETMSYNMNITDEGSDSYTSTCIRVWFILNIKYT